MEGRLRELAEQTAAQFGFVLFDLEVKGGGGRRIVRVVLDRPEGVSIGDCARMSREISDRIEMEDLLPGSYLIEVSSPGLDRPLRGEADFLRFAGERARVKAVDADGREAVHVGWIDHVREGVLGLRTEEGPEVRIPLEWIRKANLAVNPLDDLRKGDRGAPSRRKKTRP
jgi:ribosome maturation factor RimP